MKSIIITSINGITKAIKEFQSVLPDWNIIIVGDLKTPEIPTQENLIYLSTHEQKKYSCCQILPFNHYARKNIGYIYALENGAEYIYDTDDDNIPYTNWQFPSFSPKSIKVISGIKYFNIYKEYTDELVWPRGFPLSLISNNTEESISYHNAEIGVWQGLADLDPDVDAIHRLIFNSTIKFNKNEPISLERGTYCPFNSQNTLWIKELIPYTYLPSTVTFRFTDILRGYIAQRCIWEHDKSLGFTNATVYQDRNEHDLMSDFKSEIPCYLEVDKLVSILDSLSLYKDPVKNLFKIYESLIKEGMVQKDELSILTAWTKDLNRFL